MDVELAKLVSSTPPGDNWLFEVKYDGYRIVAYVEGGRARLVTRNGNDYTRHFPAIARSLEDWAAGRAMVLDGKLVVTDEAGKTDFQALQNFLRDPSGKHPAYVRSTCWRSRETICATGRSPSARSCWSR